MLTELRFLVKLRYPIEDCSFKINEDWTKEEIKKKETGSEKMHRLLKKQYNQKELGRLIREGKTAKVLDETYKENINISAIDLKHLPRVHLWAKVDRKDGVPWNITVSYLLQNLSISLSEEALTVLANEAGLVTLHNRPLFYLGIMHPLATFWPNKRVLQISFLNMPPGRVIEFLKKVEEKLIST